MIWQFTIYWYRNIYIKSVLIFRGLSFCLWFFLSEYRSNKSFKDNLQQCLYELMKIKKISLFILLIHQCHHHHYVIEFYNVLRNMWHFDFFFIFQVRQYLDRINAFSKRKSIICFINNTFSNRYCLMSSQYPGNVLILQTVF